MYVNGQCVCDRGFHGRLILASAQQSVEPSLLSSHRFGCVHHALLEVDSITKNPGVHICLVCGDMLDLIIVESHRLYLTQKCGGVAFVQAT
jgi:hypothetical protein